MVRTSGPISRPSVRIMCNLFAGLSLVRCTELTRSFQFILRIVRLFDSNSSVSSAAFKALGRLNPLSALWNVQWDQLINRIFVKVGGKFGDETLSFLFFFYSAGCL
jgi:hypothetical protein